MRTVVWSHQSKIIWWFAAFVMNLKVSLTLKLNLKLYFLFIR